MNTATEGKPRFRRLVSGYSIALPNGRKGLVYVTEAACSCPNCDSHAVTHVEVKSEGKTVREVDSCGECPWVSEAA